MPALGVTRPHARHRSIPPTEINGMIRLYRQTPEGIERTTQVDAAEQHLDSVFWIDLLTPEPAEIKFVDRKSTRLNSSHITRSRMPSSA